MSVLDQDDLYAEVAQRLRAAANEDRSFDAAQMRLINLAEIIKSAGADWPRLKDKIRSGSMAFLRGCLDEADLVIPAGDGFLVIFAYGDAATAQRRAEALRTLLLEFYLGQDTLRDLDIKLDLRTIEAGELKTLLSPPPPLSKHATTDACLFAPVWSPRARAIAAYFCFPVHGASPTARYGYDAGYAEHGRNERHDYCALDLKLLDRADEALKSYDGEGQRPLIGVSVHSTTLQHRTARSEYLYRLSQIAHEHARHLFLRVAEIEPGAPTINLADWAGILRARARHVVLEFHHTEAVPPDLSLVGVLGAGYQAPGAMMREGADLGAAVRQFRRWGEALARQKQIFFIDNLRHGALIRLAADAGAAFVTSDSIWPFTKSPGAVVPASAPPLSPFPHAQKPLSSATV